MLTAILTAAVFALALLCAWLVIRQRAAIDRGKAAWHIAMDYIAEEQCDMPHEFAACFIAGNRRAIARKFPGFASFLRQRLAEWEAE